MKKITKKLQLTEVTPAQATCAPLPVCPAIFRSNRSTYIIIGKILQTKDAGAIPKGRVAPDETVVEVPANLIDLLEHPSQ